MPNPKTIEFTTEDDYGNEIVHELPTRLEVCDDCEGHGTVMNESMRQHAYSQEEFEDTFHDEDDRAEYFKRGGIYDVQCPTCKGLRVMPVVDEDRCDKAILAAYEAHLQDEADYRALCAAERRMGC